MADCIEDGYWPWLSRLKARSWTEKSEFIDAYALILMLFMDYYYDLMIRSLVCFSVSIPPGLEFFLTSTKLCLSIIIPINSCSVVSVFNIWLFIIMIVFQFLLPCNACALALLSGDGFFSAWA